MLGVALIIGVLLIVWGGILFAALAGESTDDEIEDGMTQGFAAHRSTQPMPAQAAVARSGNSALRDRRSDPAMGIAAAAGVDKAGPPTSPKHNTHQPHMEAVVQGRPESSIV